MSEPPALSGPAPKPGQYVKISLYLKKLPHISDDYFHAYWANNHLVPAFANKKFMDKVRRYNQVGSRINTYQPTRHISSIDSPDTLSSITSLRNGEMRPSFSASLSWSMMVLQKSGSIVLTTGRRLSVTLSL